MTDSHAQAPRVGVLLANTGTPSEPTPKAVKAYLSQFLMDPRIVPMNRVAWWLLLHLCILRVRSKRSASKYQAIWTPEGFAFQRDHEKLVEGLNRFYQQRGLDIVVRLAMSYGTPTPREALAELQKAGCQRLVILPLYPQSAYSTAGAVKDAVTRAYAEMNWDVPMEVIDNYHDDSLYIKAIASSILHAGFRPESDDKLLMSFHSIPLKDIEQGDTYELQVGSSSLAIAGELGLPRERWTIAYQSRFDNGRMWLSPFTRNQLRSWAAAGMDSRVFMVCPNFAVDCLETLYDVVYEIKPEYLTLKADYAQGRFQPTDSDRNARSDSVVKAEGKISGSRRNMQVDPTQWDDSDEFIYVPCLNRSKAHVKVLAHVLAPHVGDALHSS